MSIADIGAGEGYYTVRLSPIVGRTGRVLAQDIVPQTMEALGRRIQRERLDNVVLKLGQPNDPQVPDASFDRVLLIHMYHEIERPSEFLWNLRDSLKRGGTIIVVDADRPTNQHGTPPRLLVCEFNALGSSSPASSGSPTPKAISPLSKPAGPNPSPGTSRSAPLSPRRRKRPD
jgi:ubiquinone/menaquinone biosynthesis C-methylase UbiE